MPTLVGSLIGRAADSKSAGCRFESCPASHSSFPWTFLPWGGRVPPINIDWENYSVYRLPGTEGFFRWYTKRREAKEVMKIFQYAVIKHPTEKETEDGKKSELIVELTTILASDEKAAAMHAARAIPDEYAGDMDCLEVAVRSF